MFVVFDGLDYASGRLVCQTTGRKESAAFVAFLDWVAAAFPDAPLVVVLHNVGDHKRRRATHWWLAHRDGVRPRRLAAYAHELNLIERVWRYLKDNCAAIAGRPTSTPSRRPP